MQDQPNYSTEVINGAYQRVERLQTSLKFIEACFNFLPYEKLAPMSYSLTYYYSDTLDFRGIDEIIMELKRCISYQVDSGREISIPAEINVTQKVIIDSNEAELFYYGKLVFNDGGGLIFYCWYQSTPIVQVELGEPTTGDTVLSLFNNFQEAIADQINKSK